MFYHTIELKTELTPQTNTATQINFTTLN